MSIKKTLPFAITATALVLLQSSIAPSALADTETVGGIAWIYFVENGEATIGTGEWQAAIPTSTSGDIAIPSSLGGCPVRAINEHAFTGCGSLASVTIPDSVTSIGDYAFWGCGGLTSVTIPNSVTNIGDSAFSGCSGLTSVTIPASVTSIGGTEFFGCSVTSIVVHSANPVYDSRNNCNAIIRTADNALIAGCNASQIPDSVTSIGDYAFWGCGGLTSVTIPNSVTNIGDSAFSGCISLTSVTIPNAVTSIGFSMFSNCSGLSSVTIPDSVTSIEQMAFLNCSGLTSVTIPDSVMSIEYSAFSGCSGLTSLTIPDSVATIWNDAFAYCSGLTSVTIPYAFKNVVSNWNLPETCEVIVRDKIPLAIATDATLPIALTSVSYWQPLAAGGGLQPYTWVIVDTDEWPSWLSTDDIDFWDDWGYDVPYLSGTPYEDHIGIHTFALRVTDAEGVSAEKTFTLEVQSNPNKAPVIDSQTPSAYNLTIASGETATLSISAHDPNGDALTYRWYGSSYDAHDDWLEYLAINCSDDTFDFSRPVGGEGVFYIGCEVSDGSRSSSAEWRITVRNIPVIDTENLPGATEGVAYSATFAAHGGTAPYTWALAPTGYSEQSQSSTFAAVGTAQGWNDDDGCWTLDLPFDFPFYGGTYRKVRVNSNGTLNFDDASFSNCNYDESAFLAHPMVSVLWDDLSTDSGDIYVSSSAESVTISWRCDYLGGGAVNASATLYPDGRIVLSYGAGNPNGGFIGLSAGDGETQLVSSRSKSGSMDNAADIVFVPAAPPAGMSLSENGVLSGTPDEPGDYVFAVAVTDAAGETRVRSFMLTAAENGALRPGYAAVSPETGYVNMGAEMAQRFEVDTTHPTGGDVEIEWFLDGESAGTGAAYDYARADDALHTLRCVACAGDLPKAAVREWRVGTMTVSAPESTTVSYGQNASLSIEVVSSLDAIVTWLDADTEEELGIGETLTLRNVTATRGVKAIAESALGVVTSAVATVTADPSPEVGRIYKMTGPAFVGNRLVLRAKPYGDPAGATYAWKRDGVTVATTERLDIASLTATDFGAYTLTVTTPYGTATSEPYVLEPAPAGVPVGWGASGHGRTTAPEGLTGLAQVASGMNFNLGLSTNGTITAWGYNGHGGCDVPEGLTGVSSVAAGGYESQGAGFAVKTDGSVAAWGQPQEVSPTYWYRYDHEGLGFSTYYGETYYAQWNDRLYYYDYCEYNTNGWDTVSTMPADLSDVVKVAVGGECAIALHADGSVTAWGKTGTRWDNATQQNVAWSYDPPVGLNDVVNVAAGSSFLMALRADGTVAVWNDGDTYYRETEVPEGLCDVVAIAAGRENGSGRACFALRADGTIVKWGDRYNNFGLGRETAAGAAAIDAGQEHLMALDSEGNICVWADWDRYGVKHVPATATNAFAIAAGGYHCTAIVPDSDGDSISDAEEIAYGRDPLVWEDWHRSTVSGTVATEFGPVEGARLWLVDASGTIRGAARTDESGEFRITPVSNSAKSTSGKLNPTPTGLRGTIVDGNILPATYMLKIEAPGAVDAWFDGVPAGSGGTPTPIVVPGSMSIVLDVRLDPGQGPADVGIVCLKPENGETNTMVEVSLPDGAVAYLDLWPTEMDADGTIDLGEVGSPASGAASHTVTLKLPGAGAAVPSPVGVYGREGESVPVRVVTDGPRGSLAIETAPAGATVYVDYADAPLGVTPLSVDNLLAGSHTILLHKDGYLRPRPVVAWVGGDEPTEVAVPLHTAAETNEMTVAVSCVLPDQEIYLDYRPTGEVAPATVGGMDPASHAGDLWHSASHTILLKHPMVRPWAPRFVPEPVYDSDTGAWSYDAALEIDGPQLYDDSNGDGVRNDVAMGEGRNPFYALGQALDAPQLAWTTGGGRVWRAVKTDEVPTGGFGRSGAIGNGEATWVETTVKGAGTLSFKWKTSCQRRLDMIRLSVDGEDKERLFGETDWTEVSVAVPGVTNHVLRWTFTRGTSGSAGENGAWLDEVVWTPDEAANARTLTVASRYPVCEPAVGDHAFVWGDAVAATTSGLYSNGQERAICSGWTGSGSVPASGTGTAVAFTIEADSSIVWTWATEYRLDLHVEGSGTLSRSSDWFAEGATVVVDATPGLYQRFVRWEGDTEGCLIAGTTLRAPMTRGRVVRAVFEQDTRTLSVAGCLGAASPTNGVHSFAMGAELSTWSTNIVEAGRTRYSCTGWNGTGSVPASGTGTNAVFALLEDSAIAWAWQTNYLVSVTVVGDGSVDFAEGWVEAGSNLVVTATPGDTAYTAAVWSGDIAGAVPDGLRITVPVNGPKDIAISFEALAIGRALEQESREWTTGADGPAWIPVTEGTHDGVDACRSGSISGDYGESVLSATFSGPGDLSFWWRLGASASTCGIDLYVDGRDVNVWLVDATDWTRETVALGQGDHVVEWIFWGDGLDPAAAAWLDQVSFDDGSVTETQETPVPVPHSWLAGHGLGDGTTAGYETEAKAWAANGVNRVWECYAVGLDPTDATARFRATIRFENGRPVIETNPPRPEQTPAGWYKVEGKPRLEDPWGERTEDSRFFHVRVDIPEE